VCVCVFVDLREMMVKISPRSPRAPPSGRALGGHAQLRESAMNIMSNFFSDQVLHEAMFAFVVQSLTQRSAVSGDMLFALVLAEHTFDQPQQRMCSKVTLSSFIFPIVMYV